MIISSRLRGVDGAVPDLRRRIDETGGPRLFRVPLAVGAVAIASTSAALWSNIGAVAATVVNTIAAIH